MASSAISGLSGVEWTDLNGSGLTAAQVVTQKALVDNLTTSVSQINTILSNKGLSDKGSYSLWDLVYLAPNEASARTALAGTTNKCVLFYDAATNQKRYLMTNAAGTIINFGTNYPLNATLISPNGYTLSTAFLSTVVNELTDAGVPGMSLQKTFTLAQWSDLMVKLKAESYLEASKLSVKDGGGLKTYGGEWFANGQKLSYMDITFAVRINQLFVVNNSITDYLGRVQKNNKLIKFANSISSIISAKTPINTSNNRQYGANGYWYY